MKIKKIVLNLMLLFSVNVYAQVQNDNGTTNYNGSVSNLGNLYGIVNTYDGRVDTTSIFTGNVVGDSNYIDLTNKTNPFIYDTNIFGNGNTVGSSSNFVTEKTSILGYGNSVISPYSNIFGIGNQIGTTWGFITKNNNVMGMSNVVNGNFNTTIGDTNNNNGDNSVVIDIKDIKTNEQNNEIKKLEKKEIKKTSYNKKIEYGEYYNYYFPRFVQSHQFIDFKTSKPIQKDDRFDRLLLSIKSHNENKPQIWNDWVLRVKTEIDNGNELGALKLTNILINKIPYRDGTDQTIYATPYQIIEQSNKYKAVCKELALAKFLLLKNAGWKNDLKIALLSAKLDDDNQPINNINHVVVLAKTENVKFKDFYVLDLKPTTLAMQEYKINKQTKQEVLSELKEGAIDIENELKIGEKYNSVSRLQDYISKTRLLLWIADENGVVNIMKTKLNKNEVLIKKEER